MEGVEWACRPDEVFEFGFLAVFTAEATKKLTFSKNRCK